MPHPLGASERDTISVALSRDPAVTFAAIAALLGRDPSTVSREVARNGGRDAYRPSEAQRRADGCRRRPKPAKLDTDLDLRAKVTVLLVAGHSPVSAAIAASRSPGGSVCAETIYVAVYAGRLDIAARDCLRSRRPRRRRRNRGAPSPQSHVLGAFTPIAERPDTIGDRSEFGHWEGDLIIGARNASAIVTLNERLSRTCRMLALGSGYSADNVATALDGWAATMPNNELISLTWDRGSEMARWENLWARWDIDIYFCDPHAPWQRGANEQTNGLLRWWLPKSTDLAIHTQADLDAITATVNALHRRPTLRSPQRALTARTRRPCSVLQSCTHSRMRTTRAGEPTAMA